MHYPIAPNGIFQTIQGEGALLGVPMVFVRLAGCSVGCPQCDTNYSVAERLTIAEILARVESVRGDASWVYVTGGEPTDHDLWPLLDELRLWGKIALATSGRAGLGGGGNMIDFLSVSPHGPPSELKILTATQLNLVPGLNGLKLGDWHTFNFDFSRFEHRWVTPLHSELGNSAYMDACLRFIRQSNYKSNFPWRLGVQAHKQWGLA